MNKIFFGDNLQILKTLKSESIDLIYIDPPFNTGKTQKRKTIKTIRSKDGDRNGFQGARYKTIEIGQKEYKDSFQEDTNGIVPIEIENSYAQIAPHASVFYLENFLKPRILEAHRILKPNGSLYFHIDFRESYYCKLLLDRIFGRNCFLNEIIWAYDFGGRAKTKWPAKHDNILFYVKDPKNYTFNTNDIPRIDYMAPGLVGPEKTKLKKRPTDTWWWSYIGKKGMYNADVWWMSIVGTNSRERVGYPTQKPVDLIDRIILASSFQGDTVLDFFAGSGTVGDSCLKNNRDFILIDNNRQSIEVMYQRFCGIDDIDWIGIDPKSIKDNESNFSTSQFLEKTNDIDPFSPELKKIIRITSGIEDKSEKKNDIWKNSPFEWITNLPARSKGKIAREIIIKWLSSEGITIEREKGTNENLIINNKSLAIKFSSMWANNKYQFQQIRAEGPGYVICFGISPFDVHCWVIPKEIAIENGSVQHRGAKGSEYWLTIDPSQVESWVHQYGGSLLRALNVFKSL